MRLDIYDLNYNKLIYYIISLKIINNKIYCKLVYFKNLMIN